MSATAEANVVALLRGAAESVPDRPALVFGGGSDREAEEVSFSQLWQRADRLSAGLAREGLAPGDRVIVMIPMSIELYVALLGVLALGAVAVFVDPWIGRRQIAGMAAFADPQAFLGVAKSHLLRLMESRLRKIPLAVTTGRRFGRWPAPRTLREIASRPGRGAVQPVSATDSALITFTSGSSDTPKGADRTHGFLAAQHRALREELPYRDSDVDMPMFPVFALNNLALGIPSIVPQMDLGRVSEVDPDPILRQMNDRGVSTCTASPPFFDRLASSVDARPERRPRLRRLLTGGAPVSDDQLRRWQRSFPGTEIVVVYGSTEAEPVAHIGAAERLRAVSDVRSRSPGYCVGRPTHRLKTRVIPIGTGPSTEPCDVEAHGIGELLVSGEHVCRSYFRNPEAVRQNKLIDPSGRSWHRMGDTGYFDRQGRFWLVGRVHSTIVRNGEAVHPQLVEQAASEGDPRIRRSAAVGLVDAELGQRVVLVLETSAGVDPRPEVRARLQRSGLWVDEIVLLEEPLPVDPRHNSKIDYPRLRARVQKSRRR